MDPLLKLDSLYPEPWTDDGCLSCGTYTFSNSQNASQFIYHSDHNGWFTDDGSLVLTGTNTTLHRVYSSESDTCHFNYTKTSEDTTLFNKTRLTTGTRSGRNGALGMSANGVGVVVGGLIASVFSAV
ncbi:hypothetical protein HDV00_004938 [Rhizophlyctis rosea]|nr:hypothetical protein HDV00_004938 [Rhizophlyctis rosea]